MVDVQERHLVELLPQHEADGFDELDSFEDVGEVKQLDVAEILEARHVTRPQEAPVEARAEHVDEEVETREHLEDVVECEEGRQLERLAVLHPTEVKKLRHLLRSAVETHPGPRRSSNK